MVFKLPRTEQRHAQLIHSFANLAAQGELGAARFPGYAYCHTVAPSETGLPGVSQSFVPDRWMIRGQFDHGKHFKGACAKCHDAVHSRETSDVLLPTKQSSTECDSPRGGVANSCCPCHSFHPKNVSTKPDMDRIKVG